MNNTPWNVAGWIASVLAACLMACAPQGNHEDGVAGAAAELGEPEDGFPSWEERVVHVWVNRARAAPADDLAACTVCAEKACYSPIPPLVWDHNLARAARFHSSNLVLAGCGLQHDSPCALVSALATDYTPGPCNGDPNCACEPGTLACGTIVTAWGDRVTAFGTPPGAENLARGRTDPLEAFYQWLYETDSDPTCDYRQANGHRFSILASSYHGIGIGKYSSTWTQDFGWSGTPAGIVAGVHYPQIGALIALRANWYSTGAPTIARINVDGTCSAMTLERGTATSGTYLANATVSAGSCHRYYFAFSGAAGTYEYPSIGSFGIGCGADWSMERPASCAGGVDAGTIDADGGTAPDAGTDSGMAPTPDASLDAPGGEPIDAEPEVLRPTRDREQALSGSNGCSLARGAQGRPQYAWIVAGVALVLAARRRRYGRRSRSCS